jgi:Cu/Ag efflux protein CusF
MKHSITVAALIAAAIALPAAAQGQSTEPGNMGSSGMMEHGSMGMGGMMPGNDGTGTGAEGTGVINTVDSTEGVVNITHGPIPSLSWPEMTMDLPVAEGVDLGSVQPGDEVRFRVVLGSDQVYRITDIDAAP